MKTGSERRSDERQHAAGTPAQAPSPPGVAQLLALQQGAGNAVVARFLEAEHTPAADLRAAGPDLRALPRPHAEPEHTPAADLRPGPDPEDERARQAAGLDQLGIDHYQRAVPLLRQVHAALLGPLTATAIQEGAEAPRVAPGSQLAGVRPLAFVPLQIATSMLQIGRQFRRNAAALTGAGGVRALRGDSLDMLVDLCLIEAAAWQAHIMAISGPAAAGVFGSIAERVLDFSVELEIAIVMKRVMGPGAR